MPFAERRSRSLLAIVVIGSLSFIPHQITPFFVENVPSLPKVMVKGSNSTSLTAL